jgi:hypothetical protein
MLLPMFSGGAPTTLVADFGMGAAYAGTQAGAATSVTLTVNRDGTWAITFGSADTPSGTPTSGTWASAPLTDAGDYFELKFTIANQLNSPNTSNDAAAFTRLTSSLSVQIAKTLADASADVTVDIQSVGGALTLSDTSNFAANGA